MVKKMFRIVELEDCEIEQYVFLTDAESVESQLTDIYDALKDKLGSSFTVIVDTLLRANLALERFVEIKFDNGKLLLIPMNMRDGCIIAKGKGNKDWNCSAPHGAGRIMSRVAAKKNLDVKEFEKSMENIYTTTANELTIDEAPMAYKPAQEIIDNIKDTVEIIKIIKPIYNFKATE